MIYRCNCEHGYVRCVRPVARRGSKCENCVNYVFPSNDPSHNNGYHGPKITQSPFVRRALANQLPSKVLAY